MNILIVSSSAPYGKGESFVISETNALSKHVESLIMVPTLIRKSSPNVNSLDKDVILISKPLISFYFLYKLGLFAYHEPKKLLKILRLVTDKSIKNTAKNYLIIPKAIWLANFLKNNPVEHIHAHWLTTPSTLALVISELTNIPWSATAHRGDIVMNNLLQVKFEKCSFVRFISKSGIKLANERTNGCNDKFELMHLGIDIKSTNRRKPSISSAKKFHFLCPANLIPVKGHSFMLKAISKMRNRDQIILSIVGNGPLKNDLIRETKNLGLSNNVIFKGHIPHNELMQLYSSSDVHCVILPSLDLGNGVHEGIPVSLMEAMAYNIPVVSTFTGGIPELLIHDDQQYGVLVNPNDVDSLTNTLDDITDNYAKYLSLAEKAYQRVDASFNQNKIIPSFIKKIEKTY